MGPWEHAIANSPRHKNKEVIPLQGTVQIPIWPKQAWMIAFNHSLKNEFRKAKPLKLEKLWIELRREHA